MAQRVLLGAAVAAGVLAFAWSLLPGAGAATGSLVDVTLPWRAPAETQAEIGSFDGAEDCVALGPFTSRDGADRARAASGARSATVEEDTVVSDPDYLVYVPPRGSFTLARRTWQELNAAGLAAHVIPTGNLATGLSVGTFTSSLEARNRRERVAALGHAVEIAELGRDGVVYRVVARGVTALALAALPHSECAPTHAEST